MVAVRGRRVGHRVPIPAGWTTFTGQWTCDGHADSSTVTVVCTTPSLATDRRPTNCPQPPCGRFEVMNRTIDIAQAALARHTLAAYPPDLS
jgi:hypothetical protein